ncbi:winged helix-turn-helix transcriptional regulator, partial [Klebsiella aerogenes]|uniref:winged helix-turn-helix transcriptional regulator n=1 Tax=Klebsiella aerogenes TaxID=548 RepID=UPI00280F7453|nr:transcriptional regulator [Klebsiella aerogenes]
MTVKTARAAQKKFDPQPCPMTDFVNLIAGKWAIPILYRLIVLNEPVRFCELFRAPAPVPQTKLT